MQILALSRRMTGVTTEQLEPFLEAETREAFALYEAGYFRSMYMCPERPGSMIVMECEGLEDAQALLRRLPMVKAGLLAFDCSRLLPFTNYKLLFKDEKKSKGIA